MPARLADTDPRFRTPVTLPDDFDAVNADLEAQAPYRRDLVEILRENDGVFDPNGSRG